MIRHFVDIYYISIHVSIGIICFKKRIFMLKCYFKLTLEPFCQNYSDQKKILTAFSHLRNKYQYYFK